MSSISSLWCHDDLKNVASQSLEAVYAGNQLLKVVADFDLTSSDKVAQIKNLPESHPKNQLLRSRRIRFNAANLSSYFLELLNKAQDARSSGKELIPEFISARQQIGGCVPACSGVTDLSFTGFAVAWAYDVVNAWCEPSEDNCGFRLHMATGPYCMTDEMTEGILKRLREKNMLDAVLFRREIDLETRMAAQMRISATKHESERIFVMASRDIRDRWNITEAQIRNWAKDDRKTFINPVPCCTQSVMNTRFAARSSRRRPTTRARTMSWKTATMTAGVWSG